MSGCSRGYPDIIFIISIYPTLKRTVRTHGLRGEDGTLRQLLVRERVALLFFCSEFVQQSTGSITHTDEQPLEVVGVVRGHGVDDRWEVRRARVTRLLQRAALSACEYCSKLSVARSAMSGGNLRAASGLIDASCHRLSYCVPSCILSISKLHIEQCRNAVR